MRNNKIPHIHSNEIKAWADGYTILYMSNITKLWVEIVPPELHIWDEDTLYVINDVLVEFRKAEAEGKVIEFDYKESPYSWKKTSLKNTPATDNTSIIHYYRIKEEKVNLLVRVKQDYNVYTLSLDEDSFNKDDKDFPSFLVAKLKEKYNIITEEREIDVILRYKELVL